MKNEETIREFLNPSGRYRAKPFWAWNGNLKEEELKRQIDLLQEMGFGGYFMHSRVGLETEYLGAEWFRLINVCADYGEAKEMESWIYDEDRWPFGSAGGIATRDRANRMKHIRMNEGPVSENADVIGIFSCRLQGRDVYDVSRISSDECSGKNIIWFEVIERPENSNYNGTAYLDTMKRDATDAFLACTHKKYAQQCSHRVGAAIRGIFTDEPHRGELLVDVVREGMDFAACIPYTDDLFDAFMHDWGYDLREKLPAIFFRENGERVSQVKWHYCETLQRLFLENYIKPISQWCRQHHLVYTGHMLHEDSLSAQTLMTGSLMRCYEHMDYPGVDLLGNANVNYNVVKQVSSVANQCGKQWVLSEMYGASGWHMKLEDYKRIGDWQAVLGINLRCPHLSWYTMKGERKRDYPASISFQSGWYKEYAYLEDYFARLAVFMAQGRPVRNVLVINPVESMWCSYYKGWAEWLITRDEDCLAVERAYTELSRFLLQNHVEYDYGDEEMLTRLGRVEGGSLIVGNAEYRQVIIPKMLTIRSSTLTLLEKFAHSGGTVVVYEDAPQYVDAKPKAVSLGNAGMEAILAGREMRVDHKDILTAFRKSEDGVYYAMLLNTNETRAITASLFLPQGNVSQWDPETGAVEGIDLHGSITLQPGQMCLLSVGGQKRKGVDRRELPTVKLNENFHYTINEPNVLVIDRAICSMNGKTVTGDILKIDQTVRGSLGLPIRGGEMLQPWYTESRQQKTYGEFILQYEFDATISCAAFLATEAGGSIRINGQSAPVSDKWWVDPCFKLIPIRIQKGHNIVTIHDVYTERQDFEAIYILGKFGVFDDVIGRMPEHIALGDITKQGFPYYGGNITYVFEQSICERTALKLRDMCGAAAIRVNGEMLAWQPYSVEIKPCKSVEIELTLTRRNTFGPLHGLPALDTVCSPSSFVTEGEKWSDDAIVLPCGLSIPAE